MSNLPFKASYFSRCLLIFLILSTCEFFTTPLSASQDYWPTKKWRSSTPEEQGMDSQILIQLMKRIQQQKYKIDSITIVRNGYMVTDAFFYPFQKETKHIIYSCTKSVTSTLIGIAMDKGFIKSVNERVIDFFPEKTFASLDERKKAITLKHLLTMTTGLDTRDGKMHGYTGLAQMKNSNDWVQYVLDLPMIHQPGTHFRYSNGVSYLLAAILQQATNMTAMEFAQKYLFKPLNIKDVKWETNLEGINMGHSKLMLRPHDMAKIGLLFLNNGQWEGQQIVSKSWVKEATLRNNGSTPGFAKYGYQWWSEPENKYFTAMGDRGQFITVIPDKKMVVVFTSDITGQNYPIIKSLLENYIMTAAVSSKPLKADAQGQENLDSLLKNFAQAPKEGFVWESSGKGVAKNGEFIRKNSPAFRFMYPKTSYKKEKMSPAKTTPSALPA